MVVAGSREREHGDEVVKVAGLPGARQSRGYRSAAINARKARSNRVIDQGCTTADTLDQGGHGWLSNVFDIEVFIVIN